MDEKQTNTIIVGASAAGLACAACLNKSGIPYLLLEQYSYVAHAWRNHYDRLHLNTEKGSSSLPYLSFPADSPNFVSRDEVVLYLEKYARTFDIKPLFNQEVTSVRQTGRWWTVTTAKLQYKAENIIIATGNNRRPCTPYWEGMEDFTGSIIHSSSYKNGKSYIGKKVLVVGFGNSSCEISICLHEHGAFPVLSVKDPVNVIPRGNGGPLTALANCFAWVAKKAPVLVDSLTAPFLRWRFGDITKVGLRKLPYGPNVQIVKHKRVPLLDIGTMKLINDGVIPVFPGIARFTRDGVQFTNGHEVKFDAVILGTGYSPALNDILPRELKLTNETGSPLNSGTMSACENLYFCGFYTSPLGMLREIGREARKISNAIFKKEVARRSGILNH